LCCAYVRFLVVHLCVFLCVSLVHLCLFCVFCFKGAFRFILFLISSCIRKKNLYIKKKETFTISAFHTLFFIYTVFVLALLQNFIHYSHPLLPLFTAKLFLPHYLQKCPIIHKTENHHLCLLCLQLDSSSHKPPFPNITFTLVPTFHTINNLHPPHSNSLLHLPILSPLLQSYTQTSYTNITT